MQLLYSTSVHWQTHREMKFLFIKINNKLCKQNIEVKIKILKYLYFFDVSNSSKDIGHPIEVEMRSNAFELYASDI